MKRRLFAASVVVTVSSMAALAACDDKPKYAPNPPAPEPVHGNPGMVLDAAPAPGASGAVAPDTTGTAPPMDGGRRVIANPPRIMDAPDGGYLERRDDGCFWAEAKPQPCAPGADCKPQPMRRVRCPDTTK